MKKRIFALVVSGLLFMVGCSNSTNTKDINNSTAGTIQENTNKEVAKFPGIGDIVTINDLDIVINEVKEIEGGDLVSLADGEKLVAVNMSITNNGPENHVFSSLLGVNAINEEGYECALEIFSQNNVKPLDGDIPSGITKRGEEVFKTTSDISVITITTELGGEAVTFKLK